MYPDVIYISAVGCEGGMDGCSSTGQSSVLSEDFLRKKKLLRSDFYEHVKSF